MDHHDVATDQIKTLSSATNSRGFSNNSLIPQQIREVAVNFANKNPQIIDNNKNNNGIWISLIKFSYVFNNHVCQVEEEEAYEEVEEEATKDEIEIQVVCLFSEQHQVVSVY
ncbi:hypothetical protein MTR_4g117210 [Medicago truncatula]|uniref:Uncharacterized protein n=1 Tax=Medicago truncatula TaxID=3880 RepID=G8A058_MEDTR|nr:hypothetical protein MTR_4g117210 [Medicago truncatula]